MLYEVITVYGECFPKKTSDPKNALSVFFGENNSQPNTIFDERDTIIEQVYMFSRMIKRNNFVQHTLYEVIRDPEKLYDGAAFKKYHNQGIDGVFNDQQADRIFEIIKNLNGDKAIGQKKNITFKRYLAVITSYSIHYTKLYENEIVSEWLFGTPDKKEVYYFTREGADIKINEKQFPEGKALADKTSKTNLFLNIAKAFNGQIAKSISDFFYAKVAISAGVNDRQFRVIV